jgi:hypothetical protein
MQNLRPQVAHFYSAALVHFYSALDNSLFLSYWLTAATFGIVAAGSDAGQAVVATSILWIEDKVKT